MDIGSLVHYFFDGAGPGGVIVMVVFVLALSIYTLLTRWILAGGREK